MARHQWDEHGVFTQSKRKGNEFRWIMHADILLSLKCREEIAERRHRGDCLGSRVETKSYSATIREEAKAKKEADGERKTYATHELSHVRRFSLSLLSSPLLKPSLTRHLSPTQRQL